MTRAQIEKTYGVKIVDDSFYSYRKGRYQKAYKIYSADGCKWENGLHTIKAVETECKQWATELKGIKADVEARRTPALW